MLALETYKGSFLLVCDKIRKNCPFLPHWFGKQKKHTNSFLALNMKCDNLCRITGCLRKEYTILSQIYVIKVCTLRINSKHPVKYWNFWKFKTRNIDSLFWTLLLTKSMVRNVHFQLNMTKDQFPIENKHNTFILPD